MTQNFYDVVVLGTQLASLVSAALLAKRGFRVLVLEQDDLPPTYEVAGATMPRAPFAYTTAASPILRKALGELAITQLVRRRVNSSPLAFQVATPQLRFDVGDGASSEREVEREFPEVRRTVEDFERDVAQINADLDAVLERDLTWPPETFLERRAFSRATQATFTQRVRDPFAELPEQHAFRTAVESVVRFDEHLDPNERSPLRTLRLWGARAKNSAVLQGGETTLRHLLLDKLRTHSGEFRATRATHVLVRRGAVAGVRLDDTDEEIGCGFVLCGVDIAKLLRLLPDRRPFEELFESIGEPQPRWYRFTVNVALGRDGVPEGMGRDVFFVRDPRRPLVAENCLHIQNEVGSLDGTHLFTVAALLPRRSIEDAPGYLQSARERVFASLGELVPFLGRHCEIVDSPHDGRPAQLVRQGRSIEPAEPWTRGQHTMEVVYSYPFTHALGLCAMPLRTPIRNLLHVSPQVVPGLGPEGALLAAWSACRVVTQSDRKKAWLRGRLWTKVEI